MVGVVSSPLALLLVAVVAVVAVCVTEPAHRPASGSRSQDLLQRLGRPLRFGCGSNRWWTVQRRLTSVLDQLR